MIPPVYEALSAFAAVTALVGDRIFRNGVAPQAIDAPYIVWSVPTGFAHNSLDGACADQMTVQIECWSKSAEELDEMMLAVSAAIEPHAVLDAYLGDERDEESRLWGRGMTFDWILVR